MNSPLRLGQKCWNEWISTVVYPVLVYREKTNNNRTKIEKQTIRGCVICILISRFQRRKKKSKLTPKTTCSNQFFWEFMILCRKLALYACVCNIRTFSLRVFGCTGRLYIHNRYGRKIFLKKKSSRFFRRFCAVVYARESRWSVGRVWPREPKTNWLIDRAAAAVADTATAGDRQLFSAEILWIWSKSTRDGAMREETRSPASNTPVFDVRAISEDKRKNLFRAYAHSTL